MHPFFENNPEHIYAILVDRSYGFPSHFHNNLEVVFCISGMQQVKLGETLYQLKKGDILTIFPNNVHEYISANTENTQSVSIIFSTKLLSATVPEIITGKPQNPYISSNELLQEILPLLKKLSDSQDELEKIGLAFIILSELVKKLNILPEKNSMTLPSMITSYIDNNFSENLSISRLAKIFGYHPSYIAHIFCDQLKLPFSTYLGSVRCEYAAEQILSTKKSLTEIAYESGFNSLNTFCRCFKTHKGMTPSQYRKKSR
ncbi:MAG: helix-turn-helix domain-containing protein [Ruminococcaceae bacterium]|nr:helix-turn-helix domain-containing protein [Oscillospiraceae bacterium]